jgi:DNA-binding NarL/FixJ family response regulator
MRVNVAIFEDNAKFLDALSMLIEGTAELKLTGAYDSTDRLPEKIAAAQPDLVLMDIGILPVSGIEATKQILQLYPTIKILVETVFDDDNAVFAAICAGATGYILKDNLAGSLLPFIRDINEGGAPMSPVIASKTLRLFRDHFPAGVLQETYNLSKREKEILRHLVEGMSYKMMAVACGISFETVKTYIKRIYEKLHVASMTEAVVKALRENLV